MAESLLRNLLILPCSVLSSAYLGSLDTALMVDEVPECRVVCRGMRNAHRHIDEAVVGYSSGEIFGCVFIVLEFQM
jgi:hypothetical protein